jgi:hypothetical protein
MPSRRSPAPADQPLSYIEFDINEVEKNLEQEKIDSDTSLFFSAPMGESQVRVIPPLAAWAPKFAAIDKKPDPFFVFWKHFFARPDDPQSYVSVPCPKKNVGQRCAICDEVDRLAETGDVTDYELSQDMQAKRRFLVNVIDRDREALGPMIYEASYPWRKWNGKSVYEKIQALMTGRARVNLVTPSPQGFDLLIKREGKGRTGTNYSFQAARNPSPLSEDPEQMLNWIQNQHDLWEHIAIPTEAQVRAVMEGKAMSPNMLNPDGSLKGGARRGPPVPAVQHHEQTRRPALPEAATSSYPDDDLDEIPF